MSVEGEHFGEGHPKPPIPGEGRPFQDDTFVAEEIKEKKLSFEEASRCLNTLGKDETGSRYAYLMITATDRKLTDVAAILNFKHVLFLDLSGNYLTIDALQVLTDMPFLVLLKAERNRVEAASLKPMHYLQVLDLNQNQIKETGTINQPLLECLELNYNDIYTTQFENTNQLKNLKQLELRSNLLFEINGPYPPHLEKLYLAVNKISTIIPTEFSKLSQLEILHLRDNNLQKLDGFTENLANLKYLNLRNNKIKNLKEFTKLQCLPKLEILIVSGNPLPGNEVGGAPQPEGGAVGEGGLVRDPIRIPILVILPNLKRINKLVVTLEDKIQAEDIQIEVLGGLMDDVEEEAETDMATTKTDYTESETDRFDGTDTDRS